MTRIKICGLTNLEDVRAAVAYGADALGFIGVENSPRYVDTQQHFKIWNLTGSPLFVPCVLVVRRPDDAEEYAPDYVQFYEEPPGGARGWHDRGIRSFRVRDESTIDEIERYVSSDRSAGALHLDTFHQDKLGGSGETFNWDLAVEIRRIANKPIMLAGGLTPENVGEAIAKVRPYAVDVSSGVEASPGRKDHDKLRRFIRAVRRTDLSLDA
jgi:phosphoribosylanthranilate isomerase